MALINNGFGNKVCGVCNCPLHGFRNKKNAELMGKFAE